MIRSHGPALAPGRIAVSSLHWCDNGRGRQGDQRPSHKLNAHHATDGWPLVSDAYTRLVRPLSSPQIPRKSYTCSIFPTLYLSAYPSKILRIQQKIR
jgi:hypothetical protein